MSVAGWIGSLKVENKRDEFEINRRVGVNKAEGNGLFQTGKDRVVVLMAHPVQTGEDGGRILSRSEGGIVVEEPFTGFKLHEFIIVVHHGEMQRITGLVPTVPEVRDAPHVGVS